MLDWVWLIGSPIFLIMYYSVLGDSAKRWTLENIEKELGKPVGYWSYQNNLDMFTVSIARLNMSFDQKMRFHFACHFNSPFAALGQDILWILLMNLPVVLNLIPVFITIIAYLMIESDTAILAAQ